MATKVFRVYFFVLFTLLYKYSQAQIGGERSFAFLDLPPDALSASLGGNITAPIYQNPSQFFSNPALLDSMKNSQVQITFAPIWAGVTATNTSYCKKINDKARLAFGLQYINYGEFDGTDAAGNYTSYFKVNNYALYAAYSIKMNGIRLGANAKWAGAAIESYTAGALLFDIGAYYRHPKIDLSFGFVAKNIGFIFDGYLSDNEPITLPLNVQIGGAFKPEHMPIRFNINIHNLQQWSLANLENKPTNANVSQKEPSAVNEIFQHINLGAEILLSKNLRFNIGYNHLLRQELQNVNWFSFSGFSTGLFLQNKKFDLGIARQNFQRKAAQSMITIAYKFN